MFTRIQAVLCSLMLCLPACADAVPLPAVPELQRRMAAAPIEVEVVEPQPVAAGERPHVVYLGYPVAKVLRLILGAGWKTAGASVEFRALDGYVSHVPVERFDRYPAYLVFAKKDTREFRLDNLVPHGQGVSLAPYYLVWDNIRHPELLKEGDTYWPYQVHEIALLPAAGVAGEMSPDALDLEKYCLSCHRVNGRGSSKVPQDLALQTKALGEARFLAWVLAPTSVKPDTGMPAIAGGMAEADRRALAGRLFRYLNALPRQ
ncbi:hypothetical protein MIZ01_0291 [Sideroxyarcus emersonii]|uniref:Cytochrome c domain-containing protein n=1 Tax=Sideroxyarcus emersonii TaxID=2764705 RepID=A0AAN2BXW1_9PROT|nr:cytochrome c [Sideroxyarcus emersonii]BCK86529.1 hypothetical protein MIZ01_0291 [Sideroxyarcus emersonii]